MYKRVIVLISVLFFLLVPLLCLTAEKCWGAIFLFDNKLRVKGSLYELAIYRTKIKNNEDDYRDTDLGLLKTKATLELLYTAVDSDRLDVNLFGFFQYWHDSVMDIDSEYKRSIDRDEHKRFQGPFFDQDDWINEMYADIYYGPWNIRLGKQIVFWSEVEMVRTIDRINPLDLRYTTPGIDPWDEMKLGLWMMRGFYNSNLPGELVFEWIWIPGDFEGIRTPLEGTSFGSPPAPAGPDVPRPYGQNGAIARTWRRSKPAFTLRNSSWALRIRGSSDVELFGEFYLLDWTVSWYHGMNQTPVPNRKTLGKPSTGNVNTNTLNGYMAQLALSRLVGGPIREAPFGLWEYKFFDALGASCQTLVPALKGVLRGEISYEIGVPQIKAFHDRIDPTPSYAKLLVGTTERDQVNVGITLDRPIRWLWLQDHGGEVIDASFGVFSQYRLGNVSRIRSTFAYQDRSQWNFTLMLRTRINKSEWWPVIRVLYNPRNFGYAAFTLRYVPGHHMRYEVGYQYFYAENSWDFNQASAENKDLAYIRVGYEF